MARAEIVCPSPAGLFAFPGILGCLCFFFLCLFRHGILFSCWEPNALEGPTDPEHSPSPEIAKAIRASRVDCGIAPLSVARTARLDFIPLV